MFTPMPLLPKDNARIFSYLSGFPARILMVSIALARHTAWGGGVSARLKVFPNVE
jgi:hypothetical protein